MNTSQREGQRRKRAALANIPSQRIENATLNIGAAQHQLQKPTETTWLVVIQDYSHTTGK